MKTLFLLTCALLLQTGCVTSVKTTENTRVIRENPVVTPELRIESRTPIGEGN
jgi:hypothetical protein